MTEKMEGDSLEALEFPIFLVLRNTYRHYRAKKGRRRQGELVSFTRDIKYLMRNLSSYNTAEATM